jgi:hypothetical protein
MKFKLVSVLLAMFVFCISASAFPTMTYDNIVAMEQSISKCSGKYWYSCKQYDLYQNKHLISPHVLRSIVIEECVDQWVWIRTAGARRMVIPVVNIIRLVEK